VNHTVTVRNPGSTPVLVGARYLLPGEERVVLQSHYEAAIGKDRLKVVDPPLIEIESVGVEPETEAAPAPNRKRSK